MDESIYFNDPSSQIFKFTNIMNLVPEAYNTEFYNTVYCITHNNKIFCEDLIKQNPIKELKEQLDEEFYDDL